MYSRNLDTVIERVRSVSNVIDECVASGSDEDMQRFISARRSIPEALQALVAQCDLAIEALPLQQREAVRSAFRQQRATFQSALADIQAKWPVSGARVNLAEYRRDKDRFNKLLRTFLEFIRTQVR